MRKNVPGRLWCFQSTPPRRRRRIKCTGQSRYIFFNPRLREGGDLRAVVQFHLYLMLFNPRLREGGDFIIFCVVYNNRFQSTPPRRRRRYNLKEMSCQHLFNPRLREGGDQLAVLAVSLRLLFQSTPPRRRRLSAFATFSCSNIFNPRLREGGDSS